MAFYSASKQEVSTAPGHEKGHNLYLFYSSHRTVTIRKLHYSFFKRGPSHEKLYYC